MRSTTENARRRQRTLYPLILSKARRGIAWAVDCRKRSTEAENTLPLGLVEGSSCSGKQAQDRRLSGSRCWPASEVRPLLKRFPFYTKPNARTGILGVFRLSPLLFIPHTVRSRDKQYSVARDIYRRSSGFFGRTAPQGPNVPPAAVRLGTMLL